MVRWKDESSNGVELVRRASERKPGLLSRGNEGERGQIRPRSIQRSNVSLGRFRGHRVIGP